MFAIGCKQVSNDGGQNPDSLIETNEITITVNGDEGVEVKKPNSFKVKKSSTWKDIKQKAIEKIKTKENKETREWLIKDEKGAVLKDADRFEKDTIVFAVSKDKENPTPPEKPIVITIEADEGYTFKEATKPCTIEVQKGSVWSSIKAQAEAKIELKDGYEKTGWKLGGKDSSYLEDSAIFNENALIFAISKKKGEPDKPKITITVKGDEEVEIGSPNNFTVDSGSKWASIKTEAEEKAKAKNCYEIEAWHLNNAGGTLINDETEFKENTTVFAVTKRKVVSYKVEHLKENIEDEDYTKAEEETKTGEAGKNTSAEAKQYEGFSCQGLAQSKIKADGSTVVQIKYERNRVSLILDLAGGKTTPALKDGEAGKKLLEGKFGAKVEVKGLEKENYIFEKWEPELPEKFPATSPNKTYTAKWTRDKITIEVKGDRNIVIGTPSNVTVDKGAKWADIKGQVKAVATPKEFFEIKEWHLNDKDGELIREDRQFKENTTVFAVSKRKVVSYKVEHLKENIEDEDYTKAEEETKTGEAGNNTLAEAKQYEGFKCQGLAQSTIKADGSTVVQIKYKRNRVSLILDLAGGKTMPALDDGTDGKKLLEGKFEARVEVKGLEKENHSFEKWEPALPEVFPKENDGKIYVSKWEEAICVKIEGDERVEVLGSENIYVSSGKTFGDVKNKIEEKVKLKEDCPSEDYYFYDWKVNEYEGEKITDATPIKDGMTLYARTNYRHISFSETKLTECNSSVSGRIIIPTYVTEIKKEAFTYCQGLTAVDFSGCTKLTEIKGFEGMSYNPHAVSLGSLRYLNFTDCTGLKSINRMDFMNGNREGNYNVPNYRLLTFNLSGCSNLEYVGSNHSLDSTPMIIKPLSVDANITSFTLKDCTLEGLDLTSSKNLSKLEISGVYFRSVVDFSSLTELTEIHVCSCKTNQSFTVDLKNCTKLKHIKRNGFCGSSEISVRLPSTIEKIDYGAFGSYRKEYCYSVKVPNYSIKNLVASSGYDVDWVLMY